MPGTIPTAMLWASAVVAVADAEMAELRAELEGLRALRIEDYAALNETSAERDAAEAKVARVEALLPCAADGCPCGADRVAVPVKDVRIALDPSCDTVWGPPYNHDEMAALAGPAD